jgi:hypothetical protein
MGCSQTYPQVSSKEITRNVHLKVFFVTFLHIDLWIAKNSRVFHRKTAKARCMGSFCGKHPKTCGKLSKLCGKPG